MIKICIIEDIQEINQGIVKLLSKDDRFEILKSFYEAETAIIEIPLLQPDIVISDINLPNKSGIECLRLIKSLKPEIQFIMFTIYEDTDQVFEALEAGASSYLLKNTEPHKITESLIELYNGGSTMSPSIARKVIASLNKTKINKVEEILTEREYEILILLSKGHLYKEIAVKLEIAVSTVKGHTTHIYHKLQVQNRTEALNMLYGKNKKV